MSKYYWPMRDYGQGSCPFDAVRTVVAMFIIIIIFTREHILNSYGMKEETDMTDYS